MILALLMVGGNVLPDQRTRDALLDSIRNGVSKMAVKINEEMGNK